MQEKRGDFFPVNYISSRTNPLIVRIAKLSDRKYREEEGLFIIEGEKLFDEMMKCNIVPQYAFATAKETHLLLKLPQSVECYEVSESVYQKISTEKSPQGIFCVIKYLDNFHKFATIYSSKNNDTLLCLSSLRDPGNLGTIIRTARAFGIKTVILSDDCADVYSPKTLRASMGAIFAVPTVRTSDLTGTLRALAKNGYRTFATTLNESAVGLNTLAVDEKSVFVIGNEGHGLSDDVINACSAAVYIPMTGGCESLNASIAASVVMWEMFRNQK